MSTAAVETTTNAAPVWEDFIDIFYAPSTVFARRRDGRFGLALLIYVVLTSALFVASRPMMQPMFDHMQAQGMAKAREQNPQMTDEQAQQMSSMQERFTSGPLGAVTAVVGQAVWIFGIALLVWGSGALFGSTAGYAQAVMITTYAFVPRLLAAIINLVLLFVVDTSQLTTQLSMSFSPARFLDGAMHPVLLAVIGRLDVFTLWATALIAIGLIVVGRMPKGWAWTAAGLVFVVGTVGAVIGALRSA